MFLSLLSILPADAATYFTVDGKSLPANIVAGKKIDISLDTAKPGASVQIQWARDLTGTGTYDPSYPIAFGGLTYTVVEGGSPDTDPAPGKLTASFTLTGFMTAGSYIVRILDFSDNSTLIVPGWTLVPKREAQVISGRVTLAAGSGLAGSMPRDAVVWAYKDLYTPVASASIRRDGSYTLPVPTGTYLVFAEWFGNLRSQRQVVSLVARQQVGPVDLPLFIGQEVAGTVLDADTPVADSAVEAISATGQTFATRSFADGSYVLVLPPGDYRISARGASERVVVTDTPIDGVDLPAPEAEPAPSAGTIVTAAGNGVPGFAGDGRRATEARISGVDGLAVGLDGSLFLSDSNNARIRKVEASTGHITTVAGSSLVDAIRGVAPVGAGGFSGDGGPATAATLSKLPWTARAISTWQIPATTACGRSMPKPASSRRWRAADRRDWGTAPSPGTAGPRPRRDSTPRARWRWMPRETSTSLRRTSRGECARWTRRAGSSPRSQGAAPSPWPTE
jgi:hypothetical protein